MRIFFGLALFVIFLGIGFLVIMFVLQTVFHVPIFGGGGSAKGGSSIAGGVLFSENRGGDFTFRNTISPEGTIARFSVSDFVFDPQDPSHIYLATKENGLYRTENRGETWTLVKGTEAFARAKTQILDVAIPPQRPDVLYLAVISGGQGKLFRSEDAGSSFRDIYTVAKPKTSVTALAVHPREENTLYIGTSDGLLLESRDGGAFWQSRAVFMEGVGRIVIRPSNPLVIYVIGAKNIFKTENGGERWVEPTSRLAKFKGVFPITDFAFDPSNDAKFYLATQFGLLATENNGNDFFEISTIIPPSSLPILTLAHDPHDPQTLYLASLNQLYTTTNGGETWNVKNLLVAGSIHFIRVDPSDSSRVYIVGGR